MKDATEPLNQPLAKILAALRVIFALLKLIGDGRIHLPFHQDATLLGDRLNYRDWYRRFVFITIYPVHTYCQCHLKEFRHKSA